MAKLFLNPKRPGHRIHLNNPAAGGSLCKHGPSAERYTLEKAPAAGAEVCSTCLASCTVFWKPHQS